MQLKLFSLALGLLLSFTFSLAQSSDTVLTENRVNNVWQKTTLDINSYDDQCRIIKQLRKSWFVHLNSWVNHTLISNKFDNAGKLIEVKTQTWDNNQKQWHNYSMNKYEYAKDGISYKKTVLLWNASDRSWNSNKRYTDSFNTTGNKEYYLSEWQSGYSWYPALRSISNYNVNNQATHSEIDTWNNYVWSPYDKRDYQYSDDRLQFNSLYYTWNMYDSVKWNKDSKEQTRLLPGTGLVSKSILQSYDSYSKSWSNTQRMENKFTTAGALKSAEVSWWQSYNNGWGDAQRYRVDYYPDESVQHLYNEFWDTTRSTWYSTMRVTYTHHSCWLKINMTRTEALRENNAGDNNGAYDISLIGNINYRITVAPESNPLITGNAKASKFTTLTNNNAFTISPNPAREHFIITPGLQLREANAMLRIYDLAGKLIIAKTLQGAGAQKIELPKVAKGMYMVTISSASGLQSSKLVVQ